MSKIQPLHNRVLLQTIEVPNTLNGGVIQLVEANKEAPQTAKVLAKADGVDELQIGQIVLIPKYAGTSVKHEGQTYLLMNSADIMAILGDDGENI